MAITQNHVINIQPGVSAPLVIHCSQGDTGTQINLTVVNGDEEFDCSSYACSVHGVRSDGGNWGPITCTVSGSTVCFSLTSAMTAVAGACLAEISVGTVGTANFAILMENATFGNGVTYSNDVSVYQNILNAVQAEKSERVNADNSLSSRISQNDARINNLVGNTGNSNSEIVDARVGVDGTIYPSAGEAVRQQVGALKGDLSESITEIFKHSPNEITKIVSAVFPSDAHGLTTGFMLIGGTTYKMKCDFLGTIYAKGDSGHSHNNTVVNEVFEFTPSKTGNLNIWYPSSVVGSEVHITIYGKYSEETDGKIKHLDDVLGDIALFDTRLADFVVGGFFSSAGSFVTNGGFVYTDYIDVQDGKTVRGRLKQFEKNLAMVVFYDDNKTVLSVYTGDGSKETKQISFSLPIPQNTKYVRFSSHIVDGNDKYEYAFVSDVNDDTRIFVANEIDKLEDKLEVAKEVTNIPFPNQGYITSSGKISTEGFNWSGYIPIETGSRIYGKGLGLGGNLSIYYFYDSELNPISGYKGTPVDGVYVLEDYDVFAPDGASYVAFTSNNASDKFKEVNANIGWTLKQYVTHEIDIFKKENELATKYYVGYGKTDNVRYFQKLTDCLWKVSKTDGKKEIYIHDGTYDVLEELGGMSYILSKNTTNNTFREVHPFVSDTKIIGIGHVVLNFLLDDGTPRENYWLFSCLGISGNCYIENIEIHSKNCRYSIHDESGNLYPDTERHYKNVRCYQNETSGVGGQAVGCGFSERTRITLENCYFGSKYEVWSCHANDGCSFVFKDTVFDSYINSTHSLRISQNGNADLYATLSNCYLGNGLSIRDEGQDPAVKDTTRIDLVNTKVPNLVNGYTVITQPVTSYNTLDGTKAVLLATN